MSFNCIFTTLRLIKYRLLLLILAGAMTSSAQLNPSNLTQYTELEGVPASEVGSILPDHNGYIWLGTLNGLARYDGYEFKRFFNNPNDPGSIKGLQVWGLFEDSKGRIWAATSPENLNVYDPIKRSFKTYEYKHLIKHPANVELGVNAICEDHTGRVYFGVSTNFGEEIHSCILYMDEGDTSIHQFLVPDSIDSKNVVRMTADTGGNIWIITYSGLFKIDTLKQWSRLNNWSRIFTSTKDYPTDIKFGKDGKPWITTWKNVLYEFDLNSDNYHSYPLEGATQNSSNKLAIDDKGNIWIGTDRGVFLFNTITKEFQKFNFEINHPLDRAHIRTIKPDRFGNIWIGTNSHGLFKYEEKAIFKSYSYKTGQKNSLTLGWVGNIIEASDGRIYITTSGSQTTAGISIMDPITQSIIQSTKSSQLSISEIVSFMEFAPYEFYVGTWEDLHQFSSSTMSARKIKLEGISDVIIQRGIKDKKGNLWLGTTKGLYRKTKESSAFVKYDLNLLDGANASSNEISNFFESPKHGLWLLTNNGLFLYKYETDKIERHAYDRTKGDVLITQDINSFYEDPSGIAWVGGWQGGLSKYDPETRKIETYTLDDGLPSMSVQSILADEKNDALWLSTFDGLSRFDLKEERFNNYSISDGIQGQLFADGSALKTSGGLFIFGGSNGITLFDPDLINKSSHPPRVFLTGLKLFDQSVLPGESSILKRPIQETDEIILKNNQNNITLEFAAIHYSNPSKNRIRYKLDGYENEWRDAGNQLLAFYPQLPTGQYTFKVKAANSNGVWNEEGASLRIHILPPWWNTTWAYIGYFIILIGSGFALDKYLRHRILEKERDRFQAQQLQQAKEIEKAYLELGQTHESLKATQAQLIQSEKMASLGELTAGIAHEIQNPLNFVNNFSEINKELLEELKGERSKVNGERDLNLEDQLVQNIVDNEIKILQHGKRADAIVKGMLQHSRISTAGVGEKEPVDINALVDEYFRLAYHGLRAKDKSFNATLKSDFDPSIGTINIIPQDIGRVILNVITNAFYAVNQKLMNQGMTGKVSSTSDKQENKTVYEPAVSVTTKKINHHIEIRIKDNGVGIPKKNLDKIFQPFFTTKPVGQGTGLGLSISYDIIKAIGGELKVNSIEEEGTEFIIQLPVV